MISTSKNGAPAHTDPASHDVARLLEGRLHDPRRVLGVSSFDPASHDVARLLEGRLHDPRRVLGVHAKGASDVIVRVYKPNAKRVLLVQLEAELARVPGTGLFEWSGPGRAL